MKKRFELLIVLLLAALPCSADEKMQSIFSSSRSGQSVNIVGICGRHQVYNWGYYGNVGADAFYSGTDLLGGQNGITMDNATSHVTYAYNSNSMYVFSAFYRVGTNHRCRIMYNAVVYAGPFAAGGQWSMDVNRDMNWLW